LLPEQASIWILKQFSRELHPGPFGLSKIWPCQSKGEMNLTPCERDKLMIALAASVARGRLSRGLRLNYPESIALIADFMIEGARWQNVAIRLWTGFPK
jgi:hypothetical protein